MFISSKKKMRDFIFQSKEKTTRISICCFLVFLTILVFFLQRKNQLRDNMHKYHDDEVHTVDQALRWYHPHNYRVGEGGRWLARFLSPPALIYMNRNLGGDHFTQGTEFPGLNYYMKKYNHEMMLKNGIQDPGLQDFFYFMRFQYIILFALTLIFFILFYYFTENDIFTILFFILYLGGSYYLLEEQRIFYTDPLLTMMFIFGVFFLYGGTCQNLFLNYAKKIPLLAFWYSFTISVKLSSLFLIVIPFIVIFYQKNNFQNKINQCFKFLAYTIVFFNLININIFFATEGVKRFIQGTTYNFWHYAIGHRGMEPTGWKHAELIFNVFKAEFGLLFYLSIPLVIVSFFIVGKREKLIKASFVFILTTSLFSFINQRFFMVRNFIPFYIFFLLLTLTSLKEIYLKCRDHFSSKNSKILFASIFLLLLFERGYVLKKNPWKVYHSFDRTKEKALSFFNDLKTKTGKSSVSVGLKLKINDHQIVDNVPLLTHDSFPEYIRVWEKRILQDKIVIVHRVDRNFQLTNFILPNMGLKNKRFGDYFVFYHPED